MKKLFSFTIIVFLTLFSSAQNIKINGEIENPTGKSVYLYIPNEDRSVTFLDSTKLNAAGEFTLHANIDKTTEVVFTDGNESSQLVVSPGDKILMKLNTRFFDESMQFYGEGAEKYNALLSLYLINEVISQTLFNSLENKDTSAVIKNFTESYDAYIVLVEDYKKKHNELKEYLTNIQNTAAEYKAGMINYYRSEKAFNTFVESLKGQQIVDFKGIDLKGKDISLSAYKGKITVLDFWATWCGPCRAEFPAYKELEEKYGEAVNFVSVGVYCKEEDWKEMARSEGFANNIFLSKEVQDQIKDLRVDFIPRYMVLDENHKIIDGMAPRPSSGNLQNYWVK